jgi:hypothetical protein
MPRFRLQPEEVENWILKFETKPNQDQNEIDHPQSENRSLQPDVFSHGKLRGPELESARKRVQEWVFQPYPTQDEICSEACKLMEETRSMGSTHDEEPEPQVLRRVDCDKRREKDETDKFMSSALGKLDSPHPRDKAQGYSQTLAPDSFENWKEKTASRRKRGKTTESYKR